MNQNQPALLWHDHKKVWYTKYSRYDDQDEYRPRWSYFTPSKAESQPLYDSEMAVWREHRNRRNAEVRSQPRIKPTTGRIVGDVIKEFLVVKAASGRSHYTIRHLSYSLGRFSGIYSTWDAAAFDIQCLQSFKVFLSKIAPKLSNKTIDHELAAAKAIARWGCGMGYFRPMMLDVIELLPVEETDPKGYTLKEARTMYRLAPVFLKPWIDLTWLTMCRPTETVRITQGLGDWCDDYGKVATNQATARKRFGVFKLKFGHSKTSNRYIVFSQQALRAMERAEPRYSRTDSFSTACARIVDKSGEPVGYRPHFLRHGCATYLNRSEGADRAIVDLALGHTPGRVSLTYQPREFEALRRLMNAVPSLSGRR